MAARQGGAFEATLQDCPMSQLEVVNISHVSLRPQCPLVQENTRLQSKVVRLNLGPSPVASGDAAALEELREENAELREDNDKLVAYLEALEKKKKELEELAGLQAQGWSLCPS